MSHSCTVHSLPSRLEHGAVSEMDLPRHRKDTFVLASWDLRRGTLFARMCFVCGHESDPGHDNPAAVAETPRKPCWMPQLSTVNLQ